MQITTGAKYLFKILFLLCLMFAQTAFAGEVLRELPASINPQGKYVFFLHGLVVETQGAISANTAEYGMYHYKEILDTLAGHGFIVISEERGSDTKVKAYAKKNQKTGEDPVGSWRASKKYHSGRLFQRRQDHPGRLVPDR